MGKSQILDRFFAEIEDPLLKELIETYCQALDLPDDEKVNQMVAKLESLFEERINATQLA